MAADEASATFRLALEDATSGPAASSAAALADLQKRLEGDVGALRQMQAALRNLKGGGVAADAAVKGLKDQIAAKKATIASAQAGVLQLGGGFGVVRKGAQAASVEARTLGAALQSANGPLGGLSRRLASVAGGAASVGGVLVAVAAAIVTVTAATIAGAAALVKYGIAVAGARRDELLRLEGLAKIRNFWSGWNAGAKDAGKTATFLQEQIDNVSGSVAIGREQVAGYAEQLYRMGLRGGNLQAALQGVATTAAVQGEAQAQAFASWAAGANLTGQSVKALAADVKARLGGIAARQMLSLEVQSKKLHESFAMLFSSVKLDKLLDGVMRIQKLFSQSTESGKALKFIVDSLFQPLIDGAAAATPIIKAFIEGMIIGFLYVTLYGHKVWRTLRDAFGLGTSKNIDLVTGATWAGVAAVGALAAACFVAAGAVFLLLAPFVLLGYVILRSLSAIAAFKKRWEGMNWSSLGKGVITGILFGILNGTGAVWEAVKGLARGIGHVFSTVLDMHSPSRVMARHGLNVAMGPVVGIREGMPRVRAASRELGQEVLRGGMGFEAGAGVGGYSAAHMPQGGAVARAGGTAAPDAGARITFGDVHVHGASGDAEGRAAARGFMAEFAETLQGASVHLGGRTPRAA